MSNQTMKPLDREVRDESAEVLQIWIGRLREAEAHGFSPLADWAPISDAQRVRADSESWVARFLTDTSNPYRTDVEVRRTIHRANGGLPDFLRHEFMVAIRESDDKPPIALHLRITETVAWLRVDARREGFDLLNLPENQRAPAIAWLAEHVLRLHGTHVGRKGFRDEAHRWTFLHGKLVEGARFSTAPEISEDTMWSWADRVDGGIENGHVFFWGWKHREATDGKWLYPDPEHWFDGQCWELPKGRR